MNENPAKYFDTILSFLASDYNRIFSVQEITEYLYPKEWEDLKKEKIFSGFPKQTLNVNIVNALIFLDNEKLVTYDNIVEQVFISTKGFIKIKTKGFEKEIKEAKLNQKLQIINQVMTPIIAVISLLLSLYTLLFQK